MIRLLRIEARRGPTLLVLPLLALLLGITPLARDLAPVGLWLDRSADTEGSVQLIGPFAAGAAAWLASRAARRNMRDLQASMPRSPWSTALTAWLSSVVWIVAFYVLLCAAYLGVSAAQITWGHLSLWPSAAGLAAAVACSLAGFVIGQWLPSRLTSPLVAVGTVGVILGVRSASATDRDLGIGLLSPVYPVYGLDANVFHQTRPDLAIVKIVLYVGVIGVALAALAWLARTERPALRPTAIAVLVAGLALVGTAGALDATARSTGDGIVVPAFHTDTPALPYTPVCSATPFPVCVHPAYDGGHEIAVLAALIDPIMRPVRGVPGMPVRAEQTADGGYGVRGDPPVLPFPNFIVHGTSVQPAAFAERLVAQLALSLFSDSRTLSDTTAAQRALAVYDVRQAGDPVQPVLLSTGDPAVQAAVVRFTALGPTARTTWLAAHLADLRAGRVTVEDIP